MKTKQRRSRRLRHDYSYEKSWWLRDFGGVPGWGLVIAGLVIAVGLALVALIAGFAPS